MRLTSFVLGAILAAAPLISASALAVDANTAGSRAGVTQLAANCPAGTHWANAGYTAGGKWREAHCANDDGTD
jgi:hypothetical protein